MIESDVECSAEGDIGDFHSMTAITRRTPRHPLKRLLWKFFPIHLLDQIKFELHMLFVRLRAIGEKRKYAGKRSLLVNVGAGDSGREGWVNVDAFAEPGVNCLIDARKRLPFDDNSVRGIFSEHFFEHIDYVEEAPVFLRECLRVLQTGGVLRIIVPDAEKYLRAYMCDDWRVLARIRPLDKDMKDPHYGWKYNTQMELINYVFRQDLEHKFAYDFVTVESILRRCGFRDVIRQEYGRSQMLDLCIDKAVRATESLYVEAVK